MCVGVTELLSWFWWVGVGAQVSVRALVAQDTQLLACSVMPAPSEAPLALWPGARQGTLRGAGSPSEEWPRYVFASPWAEGPISKCMELSRHQSEVCGSSGKTDKVGCLTGGVLAILGPYEPCSHCTSTAAFPKSHPQRDIRTPSPAGLQRGASIRHRRGVSGAGGGMRAGGGSHPLPAPTVPRSTSRGPQAPFPSPPLPFMQLAQGSRAWGSFQASPAGVWQL